MLNLKFICLYGLYSYINATSRNYESEKLYFLTNTIKEKGGGVDGGECSWALIIYLCLFVKKLHMLISSIALINAL